LIHFKEEPASNFQPLCFSKVEYQASQRLNSGIQTTFKSCFVPSLLYSKRELKKSAY